MKKPAPPLGETRLPSGQALLIIVLVMSVALTIGLAVISRSITDIRISSQEEESARVFSAAEAGIEKALKVGAATLLVDKIGGVDYRVMETALGSGTEFVFPNQIEASDTQTVWLVRHDDVTGEMLQTPFYTAASLNVCWEITTPTETALEVSIFYKDVSGNYKIARGAYDAYAVRRGSNSFADVDAGTCADLGRKKTLVWADFNIYPNPPTSDIILFLRLKPLYNINNPIKIGVVGLGGSGGTLPSQGACFESTATLTTSGITRRVRQCQFHKSPPAVFDYVLFSGGDLSK